MTIDKQKLQKLLWAEAASFRADCADWKRNTEALDEFLGEKTVVEVALELLAENERVKARLCVCRDCDGQGEVYSGHSSYQGHNQPPEPDMDVCGTCGGDGVLGTLEDFESLAAERDQLRAEVAGLKTGYEAYERVNAELKAENEELRANSSLVVLLPELDSVLEDLEIHGQHSDQGYRKLKDWYRKVDLACKAIDAAMGNGEQP